MNAFNTCTGFDTTVEPFKMASSDSQYFGILLLKCSYFHSNLRINLLPNDKILTKLKACADDEFIVAEMMISVCDRVENIVRKGKNADYQHFLLFP